MELINSLLRKARTERRRIALAEGEDPRIIAAAVRARDDGIADCILIGEAAVIRECADATGNDLTDIRIEDPKQSQYHQSYSRLLHDLRGHKGLTLTEAEEWAYDPLAFADLMLRAGDADGAIGGAVYTTGARVRSALQIIGAAPGFNAVSSFMLVLFDAPHHRPKRKMIFSDCGLVIDPDAAGLAEIAVAATRSARRLLDEEPRLAMLSFSTDGSASHPRVDKVREATRLARERLPDVAIEGEVQLDAAIVPDIARQKIRDSRIDGRANVLIFPDLDAGNIGYKLTQRFGGAGIIGPVLQGLAKPANDLSRGCTVEDAYNLIALTAVQVAD